MPQANDQTVKFKGTFFAPPSKCPVKTHLHQKQPHFRTGGIHAIGISSSFNCISIVFGYLMITNTMQQGMLIDELKTQNNNGRTELQSCPITCSVPGCIKVIFQFFTHAIHVHFYLVYYNML